MVVVEYQWRTSKFNTRQKQFATEVDFIAAANEGASGETCGAIGVVYQKERQYQKIVLIGAEI